LLEVTAIEAWMSACQAGFWDVEDRLRELPAQGDPLEKLAATVDFECPSGIRSSHLNRL
jgi:hypothetical protein